MGLRFEIAVYLELRRRMAGRRTDSVTSYTEPGARQRKVDLPFGEAYAGEPQPTRPYALYQVALSLDAEKTRLREVGPLDAPSEQTGLGKGAIITLRESGSIASEHGGICIVPAWQWFLDARA